MSDQTLPARTRLRILDHYSPASESDWANDGLETEEIHEKIAGP